MPELLSVDPELRRFLEGLCPNLGSDTIELAAQALMGWQQTAVLKERHRFFQVLNATLSVDMSLLAEVVDWLGNTSISAETIITAIQSRAASQQCGRPS